MAERGLRKTRKALSEAERALMNRTSLPALQAQVKISPSRLY